MSILGASADARRTAGSQFLIPMPAPFRMGLRFVAMTAILALAAVESPAWGGENEVAAEKRLTESVKRLADDAWEGRGVGTDGLNKAAEFIAAEFGKAGLKVDLFDGGPFQKFSMTLDAEMGPKDKNRLALVGPAKEGEKPKRLEFKLGADFTTLAVGGTAALDAPLVFAGYGITAKDGDWTYDDYAGLDVTGKTVILLRKEPEQSNPHSRFDGTSASRHAAFSRKISNAYEHGAAAVIFVNDHYDLRQKAQGELKAWQDAVEKLTEARGKFQEKKDASPEESLKHRSEVTRLAEQIASIGKKLDGDFDKVLEFNGAGPESSHRKLPVYFCLRSRIDELMKAAGGADLATLEKEIDQGPTPRSRELTGWRAVGEANVVHKQTDVKNVIGIVEGSGPLADETVVIGAHYDHLGRGGAGSLAPWTKEIHNGADDNASGTSSLIELARLFGGREQKPRRRLAFIAFTGEERGLIGSAHYVKEPRFSLEKTVAMVNMDMVGRLKDDKLIVYGTGTAATFDALIEDLNKKYAFKLTKHPEGFGPSDHASFYAKQIPVFHFFTGTHNDYHRPSDDFDKINVLGMRRVTEMVADTVAAIADAAERPAYLEVKSKTPMARGGDRPYFGSIPDFAQQEEGYALMGVAKESPAERAGLKSGDIIVKVGDSKVGSLDDFDSALRKFKAGDKVPVTVKRGKEQVTLPVVLAPPR